MQKKLRLIFRNRVTSSVYNFDVIVLDEKDKSSLIGYVLINTSTSTIVMESEFENQLNENEKSELMSTALKDARNLEKIIFS